MALLNRLHPMAVFWSATLRDCVRIMLSHHCLMLLEWLCPKYVEFWWEFVNWDSTANCLKQKNKIPWVSTWLFNSKECHISISRVYTPDSKDRLSECFLSPSIDESAARGLALWRAWDVRYHWLGECYPRVLPTHLMANPRTHSFNQCFGCIQRSKGAEIVLFFLHDLWIGHDSSTVQKMFGVWIGIITVNPLKQSKNHMIITLPWSQELHTRDAAESFLIHTIVPICWFLFVTLAEFGVSTPSGKAVVAIGGASLHLVLSHFVNPIAQQTAP